MHAVWFDAAAYRRCNDQFYADYLAGQLDVLAYQNFCQEILGRTDKAVLEQWHADFMRDCIEPHYFWPKVKRYWPSTVLLVKCFADYHRNQPIYYRTHCSALGG